MRFAGLLLVWLGCVDTVPDGDPPPAARILASWDPFACKDDHQRVVVELEDDAGIGIASSASCRVGRLTLDAPVWGVYRGRVYTWVLGEPIRSIVPVLLTVDAEVVHWTLVTPS